MARKPSWQVCCLRTLILALATAAGVPARAASVYSPQSFTYQGRLFQAGTTTPLTGNVTLTLAIVAKLPVGADPTGIGCLLYEEEQTVNLTPTDGLFSVAIGSKRDVDLVAPEVTKRTANDPQKKFADIFNNKAVVLRANAADCPGGYTPSTGDPRYLRVTVNSGGTTDVLSPDQLIDSAPHAIVAETIQGRTIDDLLQATGTVSQSALGVVTGCAAGGACDSSGNPGADASGLHHHDSLYAKIGSTSGQNFGSGGFYSSGRAAIGGSSVPAATQLEIDSAVAGNTGLVIKGHSGSQTANLFETYNSAGALQTYVDATGKLVLNGAPSNAADAANKGYVDGLFSQGFTQFPYQGSTPTTPAASNARLFSDSSGNLKVVLPDASVKTILDTANTTVTPTFGGVTLSNMTQGSLLFAGSSGVVAQDNAKLFWDDAADRLGIGTATPGASLDIGGNLQISSAGIITKINGVTGGLSNSALTLNNTGAVAVVKNSAAAANSDLGLESGAGAGSKMLFTTAGSERMRIDGGGNVGIGTSSPVDMLHVAGNLRAGQAPTSSTTVTVNGGPADVSITVADTTSYPSSGTLLFTNAAGSIVEAATYTTKTSTTFAGLTRAALGTSAVSPLVGYKVHSYLAVIGPSATSPRFVLTNDGRLGLGVAVARAKLDVKLAADEVGQVIQRVAGQTANLWELRDSDGSTILAKFDKDGVMTAAGNIATGNSGQMQAGTGYVATQNTNMGLNFPSTTTLTLSTSSSLTPFAAGSSTHTTLQSSGGTTSVVIKQVAAQTGDLLQLQTSGGTPVFGVDTSGNVTLANASAATGGANQSGNLLKLTANYWTGAASAVDTWSLQDVLGAGSNPTSTLTLAHTGSSGTAQLNIGGNVGIGAAPLDPLSIGTAVQGSATHALVNLSNTALSGGSNNGTYVGANPAVFTGDFINLQIGNASKFKVANDGHVTSGAVSGTFADFSTIAVGSGYDVGTSAYSSTPTLTISGQANTATVPTSNLVKIIQENSTPANDTGAGVTFAAKRTGGTTTEVASVTGLITDITAGAYKGALTFSTANNAAPSEKMRIDYQGYVGINTNNPGSSLDVKGTLRLSGSNTGYVGFAPATDAGSTTYTLPAADGSAGQVLSTNGSATLSWATAGTPAGSMVMNAATATPSGWLVADGSAVSRTTYAALFAAIGTTYGPGDGATTFNLPAPKGYRYYRLRVPSISPFNFNLMINELELQWGGSWKTNAMTGSSAGTIGEVSPTISDASTGGPWAAFDGDSTYGYTSAAAYDGNFPSNESTPQWIKIDLGAANLRAITGYRFNGATNAATSWLEASSDGLTWFSLGGCSVSGAGSVTGCTLPTTPFKWIIKY